MKLKSHHRTRYEGHGELVAFLYGQVELLQNFDQVFVWDLDRTYLETEVHNLSGLLRSFFQSGKSKKNVAGSAILLQELSKNFSPLPLFFVSASPPQMEPRLYNKWQIDGVKPLGFFSKDNIKNFFPGRFNRLYRQIGYKIIALLELRQLVKPKAKFIFWGDDSESDAVIYNLFSDLCSARLPDLELKKILSHNLVDSEQIDIIFDLRDRLEIFDPVQRVYLHLADDTDPGYYEKFGRRLFVNEDSFQGAIDLVQYGYLKPKQILAVVMNLLNHYDFSKDRLELSYQSLFERKRISNHLHEILTPMLIQAGVLDPKFSPRRKTYPLSCLVDRPYYFCEFTGIETPWIPERFDYLSKF